MVRRRNGGRRRRGRRSVISRYFEWYHGTLAAGNVAIIQRNHLEIQFDRAFKLINVHYELACSGGPTEVNLRGYSPVGKTGAVAETGVFCVGGLPRRGTLRINSPWYPKDTGGTDTLCTVDHICLGKVNTNSTLLVTLRMEFLLSPEEVQAACPKTFLTLPIESAPLDGMKAVNCTGSVYSGDFCPIPLQTIDGPSSSGVARG